MSKVPNTGPVDPPGNKSDGVYSVFSLTYLTPLLMIGWSELVNSEYIYLRYISSVFMSFTDTVYIERWNCLSLFPGDQNSGVPDLKERRILVS